MDRCFLGIDMGTTGIKSMLFDTSGRVHGSGYAEYELIFTDAGVEQDASLWWMHVAQTAREAIANADVPPDAVAGVAVSTQGIAGVLVDRDGMPLMNALSWLDTRSTAEVGELLRHMDAPALFQHTGKNPGAYAAPQLMWLKRHCPEIWARAAWYLLPLDFVTMRMTGRPLMDESIACGTLAYDLRRHAFMEELLAAVGLSADCFAPLGSMGNAAGVLTDQAAAQMGLPPGTPVALGAQDQRCAAIGAGIAPGVATISMGTAAAMCMITERCQPDPMRRVTLVCAGAKRYMTESVVSTAGAALKWFRNTLAPDCDYDGISRLAAGVPIGANGVMFYPNLSKGEAAGSFTGLRLSSTRADMARAVLEGVAFALMRGLRDHERCVGPCQEIHIFGGGARSEVWRQILADMTGKPVLLPATHETGCLGAAILAACGAGYIADPFAPGRMVRPPIAVSMPGDDTHRAYGAFRSRYEAMRERVYPEQ